MEPFSNGQSFLFVLMWPICPQLAHFRSVVPKDLDPS
jgi:hypothetical protein